MPQLDLKTTVFLASIMSALMSVVLLSAYNSFPRSIKGIGQWVAGSLVLVVTPILFWLRDIAPDWISIVAGNALLLGAVALWMLGTQAFYGRPQARKPAAIVVVLATLLLAWFVYGRADYDARVTIVTLLMSVFFGTQCVLVMRHGGRHFSARFFGCLLLVQTVVMVARCVASLFTGLTEQKLFATADVIQTIYLCAYTLMDLALAVAFMLVITRRLHVELDVLSRTDPLTQLLNRRALYDAGQEELARMAEHGGEMALLLIDLDHFKHINDSMGHAEGDRVLSDFSAMLKRELPPGAYPGRFGGEEFLVLLPRTTMAAALALAERLRVTSSRFFGRRVADLTISIGVASVDKTESRLDAGIGRADLALYRAKSAGRNRVEAVMEAA
ncbi:diguanylate cyclase [Cupriavidus sp. 2TAF22]|uniref:GGDEF domain-containing protein n=1 Tax=unclassified Cupriavidus TaxID=2640874 RepID=UPI003F8DC033